MQHCPVPRPPRPGDDSRCEHPRPSWLDRSGEVRVLSGQDRTPRSHANPPCAKNPTCRNRTSGMLARVPELHLWLPSFRPLLMLCVSCKHPAQQRSLSLPRKAFRRVVALRNPQGDGANLSWKSTVFEAESRRICISCNVRSRRGSLRKIEAHLRLRFYSIKKTWLVPAG